MRRTLELRDRTVDLETGRIDVGGELRPLELRLLRYLVERAGEAVAKDELLVRVWGYAPRARTRTLYSTWHRMRTALEADPAAPFHLETLPGEGLRLVGVARSAGPATNLGAPRDRFVGRAAELAILAQPGARLVTLVGPGGSGKTRLARESAWAGAQRGGSGWFCDLTGCRGATDLTEIVARTVGLDPDPRAPLAAALVRRGPLVVVLDHLDAADAQVAEVLATWLDAPEVSWIATSVEPVGVQGERVVPVDGLGAEDATALFVDRARARRPDFAADPAALAEIVALLDGLPLALEIAAAHAAALGTDAVLATLREGGDLRSDRRDRPARHASLEAVVAWSWARLPEWARTAVRQLGAFARSFSPEGAAAVLRLPAGAPPPATALAHLVEWGLASTTPADPRPRFALRRTVRAFGGATVDPAAVARHLAFYVALAGSAGTTEIPRGPAEGAELDELLAAATRALADPPTAPAALLLRSVEVAYGSGRGDRAERLIDEALAAPIPFALAVQLRARRLRVQMNRLDAATVLALAAGLPEDAARAGLPSVALGVELDVAHHLATRGDVAGADAALARAAVWECELRGPPELVAFHGAMADNVRAIQAENRGESPIPWYHAALRALDLGGLVHQAAILRTDLGIALLDAGRPDDAEREVRKALRDLPPGWTSAAGLTRAQLARVLLARGDVAGARAAADEAVASLEANTNLRRLAFATCVRASVRLASRELGGAHRDAEESLGIALQLDHPGLAVDARIVRARVAAEAGDADAAGLAREAWDAALALGAPGPVADAAGVLVDALVVRGQWDAALAALDAAFVRCPEPGSAGATLGWLRAEVRRHAGDLGGALADLPPDGGRRVRQAREALLVELGRASLGPAEDLADGWSRVYRARALRAAGERAARSLLGEVPAHLGLLAAAVGELR